MSDFHPLVLALLSESAQNTSALSTTLQPLQSLNLLLLQKTGKGTNEQMKEGQHLPGTHRSTVTLCPGCLERPVNKCQAWFQH